MDGIHRIGAAILAGGLSLSCHAGPGAVALEGGGGSRVVLTETLPFAEAGPLRARVVEVTYGPGEGSPPHRHTCPALVYVTHGALRSALEDLPDSVYRRGEGFSEAPGALHRISANASERDTVRFTATFVCPRGAAAGDSGSARNGGGAR